MRIRGLEQQQRRPLPAAETGRSCWGRVLLFQSPVKGLRKNQQTQPARPCRTVPQAINPVGCCLARGSWTRRNVYREDCRSNRKSELFSRQERGSDFLFSSESRMPRLRSNESPSGAFKQRSGLAQARWRGLAPTSSPAPSRRLCVQNLIKKDVSQKSQL